MKTRNLVSLLFVLSLMLVLMAASASADWDDPATASDLSHVHEFSEWWTVQAPTCTSYGAENRMCRICKYVQQRSIPMLPHTYGPWVTVTETTDHSAGLRERTCSVCGAVERETFYPAGTLQKHDHGGDVKEVQELLYEQGYLDHHYVDGDFGRFTEAAIRQFQSDINLTADGIAWPQTIKLLHHNYGEWTLVQEPGYEEPGKKERVCEDCGYHDVEDVGKRVRAGKYGDDVLKIQTELKRLGYYDGKLDAKYGKETERAVRAFQEAQGFRADGTVWPGVWNALFPDEIPAPAAAEADK